MKEGLNLKDNDRCSRAVWEESERKRQKSLETSELMRRSARIYAPRKPVTPVRI